VAAAAPIIGGMPDIEVSGLCKVFRVPQRDAGLRAALRSLLRRQWRLVRAVDQISFTIEPGEIVGFLGPNGAGKTTTLKMLTGLLYPTAGQARVLGYTPWKREPAFLRQISLLMGQRIQLNWDLPVVDSFEVQLAVYGVERAAGRRMLAELVELLELQDVLKKQVRTLSLGERMKCELALSLLYRPRVLFLDEPTIGVDITTQARIRQFIAEYNRRSGATVLLTSHYMADVAALCRRVIVIDHGRLLFDGPLAGLAARLAPFKLIAVDLERDVDGYDFSRLGQVVGRQRRKVSLRVPKDETAAVTSRLLADLPVLDLTVTDPPLEDVIERVFSDARSES
jgi:ABC-2 type transport system ATP-binding protein